MAKFSSRAMSIGVGVRHVDAANISDVEIAHDFSTSIENVSADEMLLATMDGGGGSVDKDGKIQEMTLSLHRIAGGEKAPNLACWKVFILGTAVEVTPGGDDTERSIEFPQLTNGVLTVIGINLNVPCSVTATNATIVNNKELANKIPAGITYFMVRALNTDNAKVTFTGLSDTNSVTAPENGFTVVAYPVVPLIMGKLNLIY